MSSAAASSRRWAFPCSPAATLAPRDSEGRPLVTVVNQALARQFFGADSPLGKRLSFSRPHGPWCEIVGVSRDSTYRRLGEGPLPAAYLPLAQNHETGMTLYVRSSVPPASLAATIRREIQSLEPNLPVPNIQTMAETIGASLYPVVWARGCWRVRWARARARRDRRRRRALVLDCTPHARDGVSGWRLAPRHAASSCSRRATACSSSRSASPRVSPVGLAGARSPRAFSPGCRHGNAATFASTTVVLRALSRLPHVRSRRAVPCASFDDPASRRVRTRR